MPRALTVLPDPVKLLIQYLSARPEVLALVDSKNIRTSLPPAPVYPYILIEWIGGAGIWPGVDDTSNQIDVIGGTKEQCGLLARTVRAAIWAIANDTLPAGVLCSGAEELAPQWMPDQVPVPPIARYTARYRVVSHL